MRPVRRERAGLMPRLFMVGLTREGLTGMWGKHSSPGSGMVWRMSATLSSLLANAAAAIHEARSSFPSIAMS